MGMRRPIRTSKHVTQAQQRTALRSLLVMHADITKVDAASLARSYGVPVAEVDALIAEEAMRRRVRA